MITVDFIDISCNGSFLVSNFINLGCLFSFNLAKDLIFFLLFQRTNFGFSYFFHVSEKSLLSKCYQHLGKGKWFRKASKHHYFPQSQRVVRLGFSQTLSFLRELICVSKACK